MRRRLGRKVVFSIYVDYNVTVEFDRIIEELSRKQGTRLSRSRVIEQLIRDFIRKHGGKVE